MQVTSPGNNQAFNSACRLFGRVSPELTSSIISWTTKFCWLACSASLRPALGRKLNKLSMKRCSTIEFCSISFDSIHKFFFIPKCHIYTRGMFDWQKPAFVQTTLSQPAKKEQLVKPVLLGRFESLCQERICFFICIYFKYKVHA